MKMINEKDAPQGCIAVKPEQYYDQSGGCEGCCFLGNYECSKQEVACWAEGRKDERDVIFKREGLSREAVVAAVGCLKKSLDNLPAAWKVFQQYKEAAKTLHS